MARRNVQLIISAKTDAERVLRALNGTLEDFAKKQVDAAKSSGTLNQNMKLQGSLATVSARQIDQAYAKIEAAVKKADNAMSSGMSALSERKAAYAALTAQSASAEKAIKGVQDQISRDGETEELTTKLRVMKAAYAQLQKEVQRSASAMAQAERNVESR